MTLHRSTLCAFTIMSLALWACGSSDEEVGVDAGSTTHDATTSADDATVSSDASVSDTGTKTDASTTVDSGVESSDAAVVTGIEGDPCVADLSTGDSECQADLLCVPWNLAAVQDDGETQKSSCVRTCGTDDDCAGNFPYCSVVRPWGINADVYGFCMQTRTATASEACSTSNSAGGLVGCATGLECEAGFGPEPDAGKCARMCQATLEDPKGDCTIGLPFCNTFTSTNAEGLATGFCSAGPIEVGGLCSTSDITRICNRRGAGDLGCLELDPNRSICLESCSTTEPADQVCPSSRAHQAGQEPTCIALSGTDGICDSHCNAVTAPDLCAPSLGNYECLGLGNSSISLSICAEVTSPFIPREWVYANDAGEAVALQDADHVDCEGGNLPCEGGSVCATLNRKSACMVPCATQGTPTGCEPFNDASIVCRAAPQAETGICGKPE